MKKWSFELLFSVWPSSYKIINEGRMKEIDNQLTHCLSGTNWEIKKMQVIEVVIIIIIEILIIRIFLIEKLKKFRYINQ